MHENHQARVNGIRPSRDAGMTNINIDQSYSAQADPHFLMILERSIEGIRYISRPAEEPPRFLLRFRESARDFRDTP